MIKSEIFMPKEKFYEAWGEVPPTLQNIPGDVLLSQSGDSRDLWEKLAKLLTPAHFAMIAEAVMNDQDIVFEVIADVGARLIIGKYLIPEEGSSTYMWIYSPNRLVVFDQDLIESTRIKEAWEW